MRYVHQDLLQVQVQTLYATSLDLNPLPGCEARADCMSTEGADLLVINTPEELQFINDTGSALGPWWIGKWSILLSDID